MPCPMLYPLYEFREMIADVLDSPSHINSFHGQEVDDNHPADHNNQRRPHFGDPFPTLREKERGWREHRAKSQEYIASFASLYTLQRSYLEIDIPCAKTRFFDQKGGAYSWFPCKAAWGYSRKLCFKPRTAPPRHHLTHVKSMLPTAATSRCALTPRRASDIVRAMRTLRILRREAL